MRTQCTNCHSILKVTQEQLDFKQGRVRCGHCREVFNAIDNLIEDDFPVLTEDDELEEPIRTAPLNIPAKVPAVKIIPVRRHNVEHVPEPARHEKIEPAPTPAPVPAPVTETAQTLPPRDQTTQIRYEPSSERGLNDFIIRTNRNSETEYSRTASTEDSHYITEKRVERPLVLEPDDYETDEYENEDDAYEEYEDSQKGGSFLTGFISLLLLLLLIFQAIFFFRNAIVSALPVSRPYVQQMCDALGCKLDLLKDASEVNITDKFLQIIQENATNKSVTYELQSILVNESEYDIAWPPLFLELQNDQDAILYSKILRPQDYLLAQDKEAFTSKSQKHIQIKFVAPAPAITKFKLSISK